MADTSDGEASGARPRAAWYAAPGGGWGEWWSLLHPPYTAWHLGYVVVGASLAPRLDLATMLWTLAAFFLAVGVAAHALDELHGRPLRTTIGAGSLLLATVAGLVGAVAIGGLLAWRAGWPLVPFLLIGPLLVVAYNAELLGGLVHNEVGFALSWGAFPVLAAYVAEAHRLSGGAVLAAMAAGALSVAQRRLSTPARLLRRRVVSVEGLLLLDDGSTRPIDRSLLLAAGEGALRAISWAVIFLAAALAVARLT